MIRTKPNRPRVKSKTNWDWVGLGGAEGESAEGEEDDVEPDAERQGDDEGDEEGLSHGGRAFGALFLEFAGGLGLGGGEGGQDVGATSRLARTGGSPRCTAAMSVRRSRQLA